MENTEITNLPAIQNESGTSIYTNAGNFEQAQRVAKMLASSNMVPTAYQNNVANTMIALEMATRIGASPLAVMQNIDIIHGKPSWRSTFIIAAINSCGRFTPIRFRKDGDSVRAVATDTVTGEVLEGPAVSMAMAKAEGWIDKSGSKWKTMPELMLNYRAAAFFGRLYCPDILMGMHTAEEVTDITPTKHEPPAIIQAMAAKPEPEREKPLEPEIKQKQKPPFDI